MRGIGGIGEKGEGIKKYKLGPYWCGLVGWTFTRRGHQFNSWSGYMPGLWVRSLVRASVRERLSMFLSYNGVSIPLFLSSPPLTLKINKIFLKKKYNLLQNSHGDVKYSIGNIVNNTVIPMYVVRGVLALSG